MNLQQVMSKNVKTISPDSTLQEAAKMMDEIDSGAIPVCDGDRLVGMITDRDIVIRSVSAGLDPKSTKVRDSMSSPIHYCFEDQSVEEAGDFMKSKQIRRVCVLNREKRLVGIVSI